MRKIRILFLPPVDMACINAQSLNIREIVLRLNPEQFEIYLFYTQEPDPRLLKRPHINLLRLPKRMKTFRLMKEMLSVYDIIAYVDYSPASYIYLHIPKIIRGDAKTIMHVESSSTLEGEPRLLKFLYAGTTSKCDFYTAITEEIARDFTSVMRRGVAHILPIGVDCNLFSAEKNGMRRSLTVLFVGTLVARKAPLLVVEAAARFPDVRFRVIGPNRDGYEEVVKKRIVDLDIHNIELEGFKSQDAISLAMRESDIFLLPSRVEGLPKVTLEAAASGLPCIVFQDYKTPSVVDGVTGFQVATPEEMVEKLALLLRDPILRTRMGIAARQHAECFDWNEIVRCWEQAYLVIAATKLN